MNIIYEGIIQKERVNDARFGPRNYVTFTGSPSLNNVNAGKIPQTLHLLRLFILPPHFIKKAVS
jgi:hypothetical protein